MKAKIKAWRLGYGGEVFHAGDIYEGSEADVNNLVAGGYADRIEETEEDDGDTIGEGSDDPVGDGPADADPLACVDCPDREPFKNASGLASHRASKHVAE